MRGNEDAVIFTQLQAAGPESATEPDVLYKTVLVEVTSHDPAVLKSYEFFANEAAKLLDITVASRLVLWC